MSKEKELVIICEQDGDDLSIFINEAATSIQLKAIYNGIDTVARQRFGHSEWDGTARVGVH